MSSDTKILDDLESAISKVVNEWAVAYSRANKHNIEPAYLSSLKNDIAFEFGILEARTRIGATQP